MSTQSVPASSAPADEVEAAAKAVQAVSLQDATSVNNVKVDGDGDGDSEPEDDGEDVNAIDLDGADGTAAAGSSSGAAGPAAKKKKKKSKGKGKGKALDKLKSVLGGSSDKPEPPESETSALSDELYERIVAEARKNQGAEAAAKLDKRTVMELIESASPLLVQVCSESLRLATIGVP